jgi:hypothetical protein
MLCRSSALARHAEPLRSGGKGLSSGRLPQSLKRGRRAQCRGEAGTAIQETESRPLLAFCVGSTLRRVRDDCQVEVTLTGEVQVALPADTWMEMPGTLLTRVARAAAKARRARSSGRRSLRDAGESLAAIARVVGVTRQRIKQIIGG